MRARFSSTALATILVLSFALPVCATDQASGNFQSFDNSFAPAVASQQSTNYQITGGVEPIVGITQSSNFVLVNGVPLQQTPVVTPPVIPSTSGGGGGGGGGSGTTTTPTPVGPTSTLPLPTLEYRPWTFKNKGMLRGTRTSEAYRILVNGSDLGVILLGGNQWEKELPLFLGWNEVKVQQARGNEVSGIIGGYPKRRLIGDANDNRVVDDVDISLLTRAWKIYSVDADFNEDSKIDDVDLSLLVAHWGQSY